MSIKKQRGNAKSTKRATSGNVVRAKPTTKKQQLIELLSDKNPVPVEVIVKALDWQPHTVMAAVSGLRKAGYYVERAEAAAGGGSCYKIVSRQPSADVTAT